MALNFKVVSTFLTSEVLVLLNDLHTPLSLGMKCVILQGIRNSFIHYKISSKREKNKRGSLKEAIWPEIIPNEFIGNKDIILSQVFKRNEEKKRDLVSDMLSSFLLSNKV